MTFRCGHPRDLWNTALRVVASNGRIRQECRECRAERGRRDVASGKNRENMRRRNMAKGIQPRFGRLAQCGRCGLIRITGDKHRCALSGETNWNGILCPACGVYKGEKRMKDALCAGHGSITMLYYRRDPSYRQKTIDASKHREHLKRAAQQRGEAITIAALMERDGGLCYICGVSVRDDLPIGHPLKANIDHVIPLSRGGAHSLDNVRLACRGCNGAKGARLAA